MTDPDLAPEGFRVRAGCGALLGLVLGLGLAVHLTMDHVRPGAWYEWPLAIGTTLIVAASSAWFVGKHGTRAVVALVSIAGSCSP